MHNDEKIAEKCIDSVMEVIKNVKGAELLILDDGSTDQTPFILEKMKQKYRSLLLLNHKKQKGYGVAVQSGTYFAIREGFDYCLYLEPKPAILPREITSFVETIPLGYDCVKASRYMTKSKISGPPAYKIALSAIINSLVSFSFRIGIKDCTNVIRMIRLKKLRGLKFKENDTSIIFEELYYLKKRQSTFKEIPYSVTERKDSLNYNHIYPKNILNLITYSFKSLFIL